MNGTIRPLALLLAAAALGSCARPERNAPPDWLLDPSPFKSEIREAADGRSLTLENGLVRREIRLAPDAATVDLRNLITGETLLRAVRPEAELTLDGRTVAVGGLTGQPDQAYLRPAWLEGMKPDPGAFHYRSHEIGPTVAPFAFARKRWSGGLTWPPPGRSLTLRFGHDAPQLAGIEVQVRYEIYDGLPLLAKSVRMTNRGPRPVRLNTIASEILAVVEPEVSVGTPEAWDRPASLHVETDYAFNGMTPKTAARAVRWIEDPLFSTQVNYERKTPCLLECRPPLGPDVDVPPGGVFDSPRAFELLLDSSERERRGLALRRMFRTVAPWATENPIFLHLTSVDPAAVKAAVDQCAAVGFEMIILSFGSGLEMENEDPAYRAGLKELADYAHARGVEIGGYSLLASRSVSPGDDVINPKTGKTGGAIFGRSPCLESAWGREYFRKIKGFFEATGFDVLEHDGSYPGDVCASTLHPGHRGLGDSQWAQWLAITDLYRGFRARGIYLNVPDWYFLNGSSKTGVGYREVNWSLPRDRQIMLGRQNLYDGTWEKTPSMGWTFVPLVQYHGGGEAATLEPLADHLDAYEAHLAQNFGYGIQACYRGPRLYDGEATRALVAKWVAWAKAHRDILNSDVVHWRRPDGRDIDGIIHVNPALPERGLAMFFNPTDAGVERTVRIPLYYAGLAGAAGVRDSEGRVRRVRIGPDGGADVAIRVPARGFAWYVIEP